jgi:hypothetical protein
MISFAATLPEHSNDGYVAAAYIVFLAIVLIYVAIMAIRLGRVQRKVEDLRRDPDRGDPPRERRAGLGENPNSSLPDRPSPEGTEQERETV